MRIRYVSDKRRVKSQAPLKQILKGQGLVARHRDQQAAGRFRVQQRGQGIHSAAGLACQSAKAARRHTVQVNARPKASGQGHFRQGHGQAAVGQVMAGVDHPRFYGLVQ